MSLRLSASFALVTVLIWRKFYIVCTSGVSVLRREIQFPFLADQIVAETFVRFFFYRTEASPLVEVVRHGQKNSNKDLDANFLAAKCPMHMGWKVSEAN